MNSETILRLIKGKFGDFRQYGNEVNVNCPFPHYKNGVWIKDSTRKMYINLKKKVYNCFVCEASGDILNLLPQAAVFDNKDIKVEERVLEPLPEMYQLSGLKYPANNWVVDFISKKGFTLDELDDYDVGFCYDYKKGDYSFGPRLVFPIYQFGKYRGFQARTILNNTEPKYIGATGMEARKILYNYDIAFRQKKRLVITEGFFDCIRTGGTSIATLGKEVSDDQVRLIKLGEFEEVIVFFDREKQAQGDAYQVAKKLAIYFKTYVCVPKEKDPGEMKQEEIDSWLKTRKLRVY